MRRIEQRLPAARQAQGEHATQPDPYTTTHSRLKEQRYLADVMEALEADRLSEEERTHLRRILMRCYSQVAGSGV